MPVPLIAAGIGGVSSIIGSVLSGKPKTSTQSGTQQSSGTSTPTFTPEGQQIQQGLLNYSNTLLRDPAAGTEQINAQGINRINENYAGLPDQIAKQYASRGFGSSGGFGDSLFSAGNARLQTLGNFQSSMNQLISQRQMQGASLGEDLLNANRGSSTTSSGSSTGTYTTPDTSLGNGFSSAGGNLFGLSNLAAQMSLINVLRGGGGSGGGYAGLGSGGSTDGGG